MADELETYLSGKDDGDSRFENIVIVNCVLNVPLMLIAIIGNTLVLTAILITPSLRSPSTIFLCSLALSDLLIGLVVQPNFIAAYQLKSSSLHKVMATMGFAACGVSLMTMTAIAVDRFLSLHYHMRYPSLMTTRRAISLSAVLWIIAISVSFPTIFEGRVYAITAAVGNAVCLLTCCFCYIKIYRIVRQHQQQIEVQQQAVASIDTENHRHIHQSRKSAKNTFIYFIVMILCYIPLFINMSVLFIAPSQWRIELTFSETIAFMNSSINPFLYCWRLRELHEAVKKTAKKMLCKQTEEV